MNLSDCSSCQICFLPYNGRARLPKVLCCGHTICLSCLNNLPKWQNRQKCPICKEVMPPNPSFPTNHIALKLSGVVGKNREIMCQYQNREIMCQYHPNYQADIFCLSDQERVCICCKVYGDHTDHNLVHIGELKLNLEKNIADTQKNLGKFQNSLIELCEFSQGMKIQLIQSSGSQYDQLINSIQELKTKTAQMIEKEFERALESLKTNETYQRPLKALDLFEEEVAELRKQSPDEFVTSAFAFIAQISERFPPGDCSELQQNQKKSERFFKQILKTLDEQTKNKIDQLTNDFNEFKDSLSSFHLSNLQEYSLIVINDPNPALNPQPIEEEESLALF